MSKLPIGSPVKAQNPTENQILLPKQTLHSLYQQHVSEQKEHPGNYIRLLAKWRELKRGQKRYRYDAEVYDLARTSIKELGCGDNLIALINALTIEDDRIDDVFDREIRLMLKGENGRLMHEAISSIKSDGKLRFRWSYFAGTGCSEGTLGDFSLMLNFPSDREAARVGYLISTSKTDPLTALRSASSSSAFGAGGVFKEEVVQDIIDATVDITTFPSIENEIRKNLNFSNALIKDSRDMLLEKWVLADAKNLADYFNDNLEEMTTNDASNIVLRIARTHPEKAFELVQNLDSPKHFDRGVLTVLPYVYSKYPAEAIQLAEQLSLPVDREYAMNLITTGLSDDINCE